MPEHSHVHRIEIPCFWISDSPSHGGALAAKFGTPLVDGGRAAVVFMS